MGQVVDIKDSKSVIDKLEADVRKTILAGLLSAGYRLVSHIQNVVIPNEPRIPVDRGIYRAGWRVLPIPNGAYVHNTTPYAGIIEEGVKGENVKPGKAMIDALTVWVLRKGLVKKKGRGVSANAAAEQEARAVAWAIAMSMQKKGIFDKGQGLHILKKATDAMLKSFVFEEVAKAMKRLGKPTPGA